MPMKPTVPLLATDANLYLAGGFSAQLPSLTTCSLAGMEKHLPRARKNPNQATHRVSAEYWASRGLTVIFERNSRHGVYSRKY
ncbi:hypothetical protein TWF225_012064 [Orbilia oligospora]|nr:hypothetical protein TWF225_012064 [Orbilia oligospora]KAF3236494.1 hypothetical protein TWF128_001359 [Orbilia oligospora]KAF3266149.1 hypothetical protein TWF217_001830 [Orbilia oligospora]